MTDMTVTQEVVAATAAVKTALRTAFKDQTSFAMKVMKLVSAVEAATVASEQFAVAA